MGFFLGIDGGGTKTECALADEAGVMLARATGTGANLRQVSPAELHATLADCFDKLHRAASLPTLRVEVVCAGFAGAADPTARERARAVLAELLQPRFLYVVGDMEVALEAAVGAGPGVVLIAGTGSIAYGRNEAGKIARAGGEGPIFSSKGEMMGDKGSAVYVGWKTLKAAPHLVDKNAPELPQKVKEDIERRFAGRPVGYDLLALARKTLAAAPEGDAAARRILEEVAEELARLVQRVLHDLELENSEVHVALSGGMFAGSEMLVALVVAKILAAVPRATVEPLRVTPAEGAVRLAQRRWLEERTAR